MNPLLQRQCRLNSLTADNWDLYESHRHRVTELVLATRPQPTARLAVLGAGNCNDIDLEALGKRFAEIHLVDIDSKALERARLPSRDAGGDGDIPITVHAGIDVTGIVEHLAEPAAGSRGGEREPGRPNLETVERARRELDRPCKLEIGEPFDVVVSSGLLTQLIDIPVSVLGASDPHTIDLVLAIRNAHLLLMTDLLVPGGSCVLITDMVSTDTCPEIESAADDELRHLAQRLVRQGNLFTGTNPAAIQRVLRQHPLLVPRIEGTRLSDPWRWRIGAERSYLVYGVTWRRSSDS